MKHFHFAAIASLVFAMMFYYDATSELAFVFDGVRYVVVNTHDAGGACVSLALVFELFAWRDFYLNRPPPRRAKKRLKKMKKPAI
jgi:hypothetical protein